MPTHTAHAGFLREIGPKADTRTQHTHTTHNSSQVCFVWSTRVSIVFFSEIIEAKRRALAIYPVFGFYAFLAWMILIQ